MGELTVTEWKRYGKHRVYVNDDTGARVGWLDLQTGVSQLERQELAEQFAMALGPHLMGIGAPRSVRSEPESLQPPQQLTDLADRRPGEAVRIKAAEEWQASKDRSKLLAYAGRAFDVHTSERAWRRGAEGEEAVGKGLEKLAKHGWLALHSVSVGQRDSDIDHVMIGPGGVFTLNTKNHLGKRVSVNKGSVYVTGHRQFYTQNSQHEATRASRILTEACGFPVIARGVVVVLAAEFSAKERPDDVTVLRNTELIRWLKKRPKVLDPATIEAIYEQARWAETWRGGVRH
jgi:hypothetical protein